MWTTEADGHSIVIYGCARPNDSVQLVGNPRFPRLVVDTRATFAKMHALSPELVLLTHPDDIREVQRAPDPTAWPKVLAEAEAEFNAQLAKETR